ncbi:MAG: acylneuraminate cytidylyltransferase family protein [Kiritimatiellae bacterium]|nr:acylneuraminate cytidylyltransferase family protein [Kiritimatiellia bacterium]
MSILGLITARGGSKGIPRKNIVDLGGKPLIAWTIEAAQQSQSIDRVLVSTDDEEIADVARSSGAEVPFMRPEKLARDGSAHIPVIQHALQWIKQDEGALPDFVCLLQPTSPFRTSAHIDAAVQLLHEKKADAVVSVCEAKTHPFLTRKLDENGLLQPFMSIPSGYLRRQDFPPAYEINGAIYLCRSRIVTEQGTLLPEKTGAFVMDEKASLDIDTPDDLERARSALRVL